MGIDVGRLADGLGSAGWRAVRCVSASAVTLCIAVVAAAPAWADNVNVNPTASGLTFGAKIQKMLDWGGQIALWACLASILAGAGAWGLSKHFGSYGGANKGMQLVIGGAVGALVVASAPLIVNSMFGG
jgi:hypothetical protein